MLHDFLVFCQDQEQHEARIEYDRAAQYVAYVLSTQYALHMSNNSSHHVFHFTIFDESQINVSGEEQVSSEYTKTYESIVYHVIQDVFLAIMEHQGQNAPNPSSARQFMNYEIQKEYSETLLLKDGNTVDADSLENSWFSVYDNIILGLPTNSYLEESHVEWCINNGTELLLLWCASRKSIYMVLEKLREQYNRFSQNKENLQFLTVSNDTIARARQNAHIIRRTMQIFILTSYSQAMHNTMTQSIDDLPWSWLQDVVLHEFMDALSDEKRFLEMYYTMMYRELYFEWKEVLLEEREDLSTDASHEEFIAWIKKNRFQKTELPTQQNNPMLRNKKQEEE